MHDENQQSASVEKVSVQATSPDSLDTDIKLPEPDAAAIAGIERAGTDTETVIRSGAAGGLAGNIVSVDAQLAAGTEPKLAATPSSEVLTQELQKSLDNLKHDPVIVDNLRRAD